MRSPTGFPMRSRELGRVLGGGLMMLLLATFSSTVQAADFAVLTVGGNASPELARQVRAETSEALRELGRSVLSEADLALHVPPDRLSAVTTLEQADEVARTAGAEGVAAVAVWTVSEGGAAPEPRSVTLSVRSSGEDHVATTELGAGGLSAAIREALERTRPMARAAVEPTPEVVAAPAPVAPASSRPATPGYDIIGPAMLAAAGAVAVGLGVYALVDGTCTNRGDSGVCLAGESPNVPAGVVLSVVGGLALAGAVVWLFTGRALDSQQPRIDVVLGPEGGFMAARGSF